MFGERDWEEKPCLVRETENIDIVGEEDKKPERGLGKEKKGYSEGDRVQIHAR